MLDYYEFGRWTEFCVAYHKMKRSEITEDDFKDVVKKLFRVTSFDGHKFNHPWTENELLEAIGEIRAAYELGEESSLSYDYVLQVLDMLRAYVCLSWERDRNCRPWWKKWLNID